MSSDQREYEFGYQPPRFRYLVIGLQTICLLAITAIALALVYTELGQTRKLLMTGGMLCVCVCYINLYRVERSLMEVILPLRGTRGIGMLIMAIAIVLSPLYFE